jgi:hypothetical protein
MEAANPLRHTKHIFRVVLLLVFVVVALTLGRTFFVPKSFGAYGPYRGDNVAEQMQKPVRHGNDESCKSCHAAEFDTHAAGKHEKVRCEVCHAPVATHAADGKKIAAMPTMHTRTLCLRCHRQLDARPTSFPQIQPQQHVEEQGGTWKDDACFDCHQPHAPSPE